MVSVLLACEVKLPLGVEVTGSSHRAQTQDGFGAGQRPTCTCPVHSVFHEVATRPFDNAGSDWQTVSERLLIFNYSNAGMTMAAAALERATGRSFVDLVRERIFGPAGMHGATYALVSPQQAHAYGHAADGLPVHDEPTCGLSVAAGAAWMSARDLASLAQGLLRVDAPLVTTTDLMEILHEERSTTGAAVDYAGLGIFLRHYRGRTIAYHGGTMDGFSAFFVLVPDEKFALAVLLNAAGSASFPGSAVDLYLPPREPLGAPPIATDSFPRYVGTYADSHGELGTFRIESAGDGIFRMVPLGGRRVERFNDAFSGTFWLDASGAFKYFATRWGVAVRVAD